MKATKSKQTCRVNRRYRTKSAPREEHVQKAKGTHKSGLTDLHNSVVHRLHKMESELVVWLPYMFAANPDRGKMKTQDLHTLYSKQPRWENFPKPDINEIFSDKEKSLLETTFDVLCDLRDTKEHLNKFKEIISRPKVARVLLNPCEYVKAFRMKKPKSKKEVLTGKGNVTNHLGRWNTAVRKARERLGIHGSVRPKKNYKLYEKAHELHAVLP